MTLLQSTAFDLIEIFIYHIFLFVHILNWHRTMTTMAIKVNLVGHLPILHATKLNYEITTIFQHVKGLDFENWCWKETNNHFLTSRMRNGRKKYSNCLKKIDPDLQLPFLQIFSLLDKSYKGNILDISPQRTFVCRWVVNVGRMWQFL